MQPNIFQESLLTVEQIQALTDATVMTSLRLLRETHAHLTRWNELRPLVFALSRVRQQSAIETAAFDLLKAEA